MRPEQPEWVSVVNAGGVDIVDEVALRPLTPGALIGEVAARRGYTTTTLATVDDELLEPLHVLCQALEEEAALTVLGRWMTRRFLLRLLEGREHIAERVAAEPAIAAETVRAPVVIAGAPRSGTTVLHRLLAETTGLRAPEGWELLYPAPGRAPEADPDLDPRLPLAADELSLPQRISGELTSIHAYSARMHKECLSAMSFAFRSEELISRYHVPGYVEWLQGCDMTPAYLMHRRVLQVLQRRLPGTRWVLKSPVHLHHLPTLLAVYPDARLLLTHRDPLTVLASVSSLVATLRHAFSDHVDPAAVGRYHADLYCGSLDRLVDLVDEGSLPADRTAHIDYGALTADAPATIARAYADLGIELDPAAARAIETAAAAAAHEHAGAHDYRFEDYGLDRDQCRGRLTRYADRFGVVMAP